jgi:N-acetyl-anhydromuramyl-L-alanine amidase AmpD
MPTIFETDKFPFVKAHFFKEMGSSKRQVRLIVVHSMESEETNKTAENVAHFFQDPPNPVSAHLCIDNDSIVQCVLDNDIAFAAPGANSDGVHLELAGRAKQTRDEWLDPFGRLLLENAANAAAQYCLKFDIPVKHLTNAELADKSKRGFVGHIQVTEVFKKGTHTDPGPNFPWDFFIERVQHHHDERTKNPAVGNN